MAAKWKAAALTVVAVGAGLFAIALVSGLIYEQTQRARDRERFPQVGRSVDIGGRTLNIHCAGSGRPTVILQAGATWPLNSTVHDPKSMLANGGPRPGYSWVAIQRALSAVTTVCWYDRAGSGWSDPGPYPRDSAAHANDLHALLRVAGVSPPYVLVADSSAGLDARVYTGAYPSDVAGLVFVNWADPALFLAPQTNNGKRAKSIPKLGYHAQDLVAQLINQVGLLRFSKAPPAPAPPQGITAAEWNTIWFLSHSSKSLSALIQDIASWRLSSDEAVLAGTLGDRPVIVLSAPNIAASPAFCDAWTNAQRDLARLSTRGQYVVASGGAGDLLYEAPDSITDAVRQVVAQLRPLETPRP